MTDARLGSSGTGKTIKEQILHGAIGTAATKIFGLALSIALSILLARVLGAKDFGIYSVVLSIAALCSIPAQFGLPNLIIRETAISQSKSDWNAISALWNWANLYVFTTSAIIFMAWLVASYSLGGNRYYELGMYAVLLVPILSLGGIRSAALRGLSKVALGVFPELVLRPLLLILGVTLVVALGKDVTAKTAMNIQLGAAAAAFVFGAFCLHRFKPLELVGRWSWRFDYRWLRAILPLAIVATAGIINQHIDVLMIGYFATPEDVAQYKIAVQVASLIGIPALVAVMVAGPHIARMYSAGQLRDLQTILTKLSVVAFFVSILVAGAVYLMGRFALDKLLGDEYSFVFGPLMILVCGQLIVVFMGFSGTVLSLTRNETVAMVVVLLAVVTNVGANFLLIPHFGIIGAAYASTSILVLKSIVLYAVTLRKLSIHSGALGLALNSNRRIG